MSVEHSYILRYNRWDDDSQAWDSTNEFVTDCPEVGIRFIGCRDFARTVKEAIQFLEDRKSYWYMQGVYKL